MKKFLAKLALFSIVSIVLAMPLQAYANDGDPCITDEEKKNFIVTIIEEPLGDAKNYTERKGKVNNVETTVFKAENCCRKIEYFIPAGDTTSGKKLQQVDSLTKGLCTACGNIETKYGDKDPITGVKPVISKTGAICNQVMALYSVGGTTMLEGYISVIYNWAAGIVGLIAVTVIIISGIQIATSGGDSAALDAGKNRIIKSLSGLAVLFLSGLILYTINPNFFVAT
jgi:hypothetical protein